MRHLMCAIVAVLVVAASAVTTGASGRTTKKLGFSQTRWEASFDVSGGPYPGERHVQTIANGKVYAVGKYKAYAFDLDSGAQVFVTPGDWNVTADSGAACGQTTCVVALTAGSFDQRAHRRGRPSQTEEAVKNLPSGPEYFTAFDASTGAHLWTIKQHWPGSTNHIDDAHNLALLSANVGTKAVHQRTGEVVWDNKDLNGPYYISGSTVYGSHFSGIMAVDVQTGAVLWKTKFSWQYGAGVCHHDGTLYSTGQSTDDWPQLSAASTSGTKKYTRKVYVKDFNSYNVADAGSPVCSGSRVFITGSQVGVQAIDASSGTEVWDLYSQTNEKCNTPSNANPHVDSRGIVWIPCYAGIYAGETTQTVVGLDPSSGATRYNFTVATEDDRDTHVRTGTTSGGTEVVVAIMPTKGKVYAYSLN